MNLSLPCTILSLIISIRKPWIICNKSTYEKRYQHWYNNETSMSLPCMNEYGELVEKIDTWARKESLQLNLYKGQAFDLFINFICPQGIPKTNKIDLTFRSEVKNRRCCPDPDDIESTTDGCTFQPALRNNDKIDWEFKFEENYTLTKSYVNKKSQERVKSKLTSC